MLTCINYVIALKWLDEEKLMALLRFIWVGPTKWRKTSNQNCLFFRMEMEKQMDSGSSHFNLRWMQNYFADVWSFIWWQIFVIITMFHSSRFIWNCWNQRNHFVVSELRPRDHNVLERENEHAHRAKNFKLTHDECRRHAPHRSKSWFEFAVNTIPVNLAFELKITSHPYG